MRSFDWHYDDSHEWLEVDLDYLMVRGLANKISSFSYYSKEDNKAYLEGDCDARILLDAMGNQWNNNGSTLIDRGESIDNPIRDERNFPIIK